MNVTLSQYKARYWYILSAHTGNVVGRIERSGTRLFNVFINADMTWHETPCDDIRDALGFATDWEWTAS